MSALPVHPWPTSAPSRLASEAAARDGRNFVRARLPGCGRDAGPAAVVAAGGWDVHDRATAPAATGTASRPPMINADERAVRIAVLSFTCLVQPPYSGRVCCSQLTITAAISRLFLSSIITWLLPWMPRSASLMKLGLTPAWRR